jgi:predicted RNA-binding protein
LCEFKVLNEGEVVFEGAVYAKVDGSNVTVRDVLGVSKTFEKTRITEVNVNSERLLLAAIENEVCRR